MHMQEPFVDIPENVIRDALKVLLGNTLTLFCYCLTSVFICFYVLLSCNQSTRMLAFDNIVVLIDQCANPDLIIAWVCGNRCEEPSHSNPLQQGEGAAHPFHSNLCF